MVTRRNLFKGILAALVAPYLPTDVVKKTIKKDSKVFYATVPLVLGEMNKNMDRVVINENSIGINCNWSFSHGTRT